MPDQEELEYNGVPVAASHIGRQFVRSYYDVRINNPGDLYRFYAEDSSRLNHGVEGKGSSTSEPPVVGQKNIMESIKNNMESPLSILKVQITTVDSQLGPSDSVLIQVLGSATSKDSITRKFCQTFCLQQVLSGTMSITNDMFRFLTEEPAVSPEPPAPNSNTNAASIWPTKASDGAAESVAVAVAVAVAVDAQTASTKVAPIEVAKTPEPVKQVAPEPPEPVVVVETPKVAVAAVEEVKKPEAAAPTNSPPAPKKTEHKAAITEVVSKSPPPAADVQAPKTTGTWAELTKVKAVTAGALPASTGGKAITRSVPRSKVEAKPVAKSQAATKPSTENQKVFEPRRGERCPLPARQGCSLYVRHVPKDCTKEDLVKAFEVVGKIRVDSKYGPCINIQDMKNPPKNPDHPLLRYAFVEFEENQALLKCLSPDFTDSFKVSTETGEQRLSVEERMPRMTTGSGKGRGTGADGRGRGRGVAERGRGRGEGRGRGGRRQATA